MSAKVSEEPGGNDRSGVDALSGLPVTLDPKTKSGVPPARTIGGAADLVHADMIAQLLAAGSTRTEANLNQLIRGLGQLASGAMAALEANGELVRLLDELRSVLTECSSTEETLHERIRTLESRLEETARAAADERATLLEQEDAFISELVDDHEREKATLTERIVALEESLATKPGAGQGSSSRAIGVIKLRSVQPMTDEEERTSSVRPMTTYALGRGQVKEESLADLTSLPTDDED